MKTFMNWKNTAILLLASLTVPVIAHGEDGILASSWGDVKYVFCENQGIATLVDLSNSSLGNGNLQPSKLWVRACNSPGPGREYSFTKKQFSVKDRYQYTMALSTDSFSLEIVGEDQNIFPKGDGDLGGNSGTCFFLRNSGTQGLSSYCE